VLALVGSLRSEIDLFEALLVNLGLTRTPEHLLCLLAFSLDHEFVVEWVIRVIACLTREGPELIFLFKLFLIKQDLGGSLPWNYFFFALGGFRR